MSQEIEVFGPGPQACCSFLGLGTISLLNEYFFSWENEHGPCIQQLLFAGAAVVLDLNMYLPLHSDAWPWCPISALHVLASVLDVSEISELMAMLALRVIHWPTFPL
jgi:hypothetical protein